MGPRRVLDEQTSNYKVFLTGDRDLSSLRRALVHVAALIRDRGSERAVEIDAQGVVFDGAHLEFLCFDNLSDLVMEHVDAVLFCYDVTEPWKLLELREQAGLLLPSQHLQWMPRVDSPTLLCALGIEKRVDRQRRLLALAASLRGDREGVEALLKMIVRVAREAALQRWTATREPLGPFPLPNQLRAL